MGWLRAALASHNWKPELDLNILISLTILALAVILFVTERLRVDLIALLVLGGLALAGQVTPAEALSGFSNPAVVTVWAVFILSGGLSRTGVAGLLGRQVLRVAGQGEVRLILVIMLTAGLLSAFMNNVGVAAMLLPVVVDIAQETGRSRSKLLIPLAFGSLLGGLTTLIGTPPNILASDALRDFGMPPFRMFDFAPVGLVVMFVGIVFMALVGRRLLPDRDATRSLVGSGRATLGQVYGMRELLFVVRLPPGSRLVGTTLAQSRIGSALGLSVFGIQRQGVIELAPTANLRLQADDQLLVAGRLDQVNEIHGWQRLGIEGGALGVEDLVSDEISISEIRLSPGSSVIGETLERLDFRQRYGVNVLAIWRDGAPLRTHLQNVPLHPEDILLIQAPSDRLEQMRRSGDFLVSDVREPDLYRLHERLLKISVPPESTLIGKTLAESRLGDAFGLSVLGIQRDGRTQLVPDPEAIISIDDTLLVEGREEDVRLLLSLQELRIDRDTMPDLRKLESNQVGLMEAVLSPHTTLAGKTLRQLHFREKYGLNVLAIWREGEAYHINLREMPLRFGDALLLYGPREKFRLLGEEPDFLVLAEETQEAPRSGKIPFAATIMLAVVLSVILGWLPISIAAVIGAALMVLTGCLNMEEAYRFIDWRAVFLIAGMLPLGLAMEKSGAAQFLAEGVVAAVGDFGPLVLLAGIYVLTALASQFMPNPVVTVLMAPIALSTALDQGLSARALMMVVAIAASASFLSPVGHPANVLVMGPGGYRFVDYFRIGVPLTVLVLVIVLLVLPVFWPLTGP